MKKITCILFLLNVALFAGKIKFHTTSGITEIDIANFVKLEILPKTPEGFVFLEGGTYQRGDEIGDLGYGHTPVHQVTLSSFYMAKYEVTQAEWQSVMTGNNNNISTTPSNFTGNSLRPVDNISWYGILVFCNRKSISEGLIPVYCISGSTNSDSWGTVPVDSNSTWDAVTCNWSANGYRLPTEAEWEYAARGGAQSNGYLYSGSNNINDVAWYYGDSDYTTHPVGTKTPNELGLYDMSGNVWEWNWDWFGNCYTADAQTNPTGAASGYTRVFRGGDYYLSYNGLKYCRVAFRNYYYYYIPPYDENGIGFRLARTY